jgi:hypothetical protein
MTTSENSVAPSGDESDEENKVVDTVAPKTSKEIAESVLANARRQNAQLEAIKTARALRASHGASSGKSLSGRPPVTPQRRSFTQRRGSK